MQQNFHHIHLYDINIRRQSQFSCRAWGSLIAAIRPVAATPSVRQPDEATPSLCLTELHSLKDGASLLAGDLEPSLLSQLRADVLVCLILRELQVFLSIAARCLLSLARVGLPVLQSRGGLGVALPEVRGRGWGGGVQREAVKISRVGYTESGRLGRRAPQLCLLCAQGKGNMTVFCTSLVRPSHEARPYLPKVRHSEKSGNVLQGNLTRNLVF